MEDNNDIRPRRKPLERVSYSEKGRFFKFRNILNTIFIVLAIVGMATYFYKSQTVGGIVLIAAVFIKLTECFLRIMR